MKFCPLKRIHSLLLLLFLPFIFIGQNLTQYVNPFIGTGGHGHTFPGAVLPFGMVQLSPDTRIDESWDGCSGYHYSDSVIYGFSHTHLSGTGVSDWGDIMLMPTTGKPSFDNKIYSSKFSHALENANPGFYEVLLDDEKIKVELTVTPRVGIHKYNFPKGGEANVVLDLLHRDKLLKGSIKIIDSNTAVGYRVSEAWAKEQHCYFAIKFSQAIKKTLYAKDKTPVTKSDLANTAVFQFRNYENKPLIVKVGISSVSEEGALLNLNAEAPYWNFEKYKNDAETTWNDQLKKIDVADPNKNKLTIFYSALYHCGIHPSLNMDVDSKFRGRDNEIHLAYGFTNYSVFSLWDTYRALHPLLTILEPKRTSDFINTFYRQYKDAGRLPVWELSANETDCMIGYHAASVIADALAKGINDIDTVSVYKALLAAANYSGFGIPAYCKKNYLSAEDESESVSRTLEYAYDDWCIAQVAQKLNRVNDYNYFIKKAQSYKNIFDPGSGFMRPRKNGNWLSPFDPKEVNNYYTEGNSWQYSFYAPQDIEGLIALHGGEKKFEQKLDSLFLTGSQTSGREQADISGLIGQYAHGNEPSHHMAYLYNYIGKPHKTQDKVSRIMNDFYKNSPDGLIGNEDCGQMSAWYVFSSLGFYPVCPGSSYYVIGKPLFDTVKINLEKQKQFVISKTGRSEPGYINSISINRNKSLRSVINHNQIISGGTLNFSFSNVKDTSNKFGQAKAHRPTSRIDLRPIVISPVIISNSKSFENKQQINIEGIQGKNLFIYYTVDGTEPDKKSKIYKEPFFIESSCKVKSISYSESDSSTVTGAEFFKKSNNWNISTLSKYTRQYNGGGDNALIDGIYGDVNWKKGEWQGYQYQDFECIIDLKKEQPLNYLSLNFLQDTRAWIIFPVGVDIYISNDNKNFTLAGSITGNIPAKDYTAQTKKFEKQLSKKETARYVKFVAKNFGKLPEWHAGKDDGAYIFIDEIEIK